MTVFSMRDFRMKNLMTKVLPYLQSFFVCVEDWLFSCNCRWMIIRIGSEKNRKIKLLYLLLELSFNFWMLFWLLGWVDCKRLSILKWGLPVQYGSHFRLIKLKPVEFLFLFEIEVAFWHVTKRKQSLSNHRYKTNLCHSTSYERIGGKKDQKI